MRLAIGPLYAEDTAEKTKCSGKAPKDPDDVARYFATKLTRCLIHDQEGLCSLLFNSADITPEEFDRVGVTRKSETGPLSLNALLTSIAGFISHEDKPDETRLLTITKPSTNEFGLEIVGFTALNDSRDLLARIQENVNNKKS